MKKRTTLRKFIENFPVKSFRDNPLKDLKLKEKSWDELIKLSDYVFPTGKCLSVKDGHIYYAEITYQVKRCGTNFFKHSAVTNYIYIDPKEISLHCCISFICEFFKLAGITWIKELQGEVRELHNKSIFKSILINSIYNQETYYKAIGKRVFKCNDLNWKSIRAYFNIEYAHINLNDLKYFTVNANNSLDVWLHSDYEKRRLLYDLLSSAVKLNQKVNFNWSDKRINEEHTKQTRELMKKEISSKDNNPIYINLLEKDPNIYLLNTELAIFLEGTNMHHCVYTNYYDKIRNHKYIAMHMKSPEDCTMGITLDKDGVPYLQQIYLKYDRRVQPETKAIAEKYVSDNFKSLQEMFLQRCPENIEKIEEPVVEELNLDLIF